MGLGAGKKKKKSGDGENVVGKTPFMLLTEKERGVEKLVVVEEVAGRKPPWFRCSVTLNGVDFSGEGSSKKMAKHVTRCGTMGSSSSIPGDGATRVEGDGHRRECELREQERVVDEGRVDEDGRGDADSSEVSESLVVDASIEMDRVAR